MLRIRRSLLGLALSLMLATAFVACQAEAQPPSTQRPVATQPAAPKPAVPSPSPTEAGSVATQSAKVVTVLMSQEPDTLLPGASSMLAQEQVLGALWTDLVARDEKNNVIPWGGEAVPTIDSGGAKFVGEGADKHLEVTFKIKKDLRWHDGTPVTADDVKYTVDLLQNPDFPAQQRDLALKIAEVRAVNDHTAVIALMSENQARKAAKEGWHYKNAEFYERFAEQSGPVVDPLYYLAGDAGGHLLPAHVLGKTDPKDMEKSDYARAPIGSGPYKFEDWVPGQNIVLKAAETSVFGQPKIETVVFSIKADATAMLNALAAGEGHATTQGGLDVDQSPEIDSLVKQGKIRVHYIPATAYEHVTLNFANEALQDKRVRQAIAHAIDRETMVDKLLYGKGQVMHSWIAPPHWAYDDTAVVKYDYNPAKAKDLLAQAGYETAQDGYLEKDGKPLALQMYTTNSKLRQALGPLIQANLKDVGIKLDVEYLPARDFGEVMMGHKFDLALFRFISEEDPDPTAIYHSQSCPDGMNVGCWHNEQADDLMIRAASSLSQKERAPLYGELLKIWTAEVPDIPLFQSVNVTAVSPKLQNFKPTSAQRPETWNIHEWILPAN